MKNYVSSYWDRISGSTLCELVELFGDKICWPWPELESRHGYRDGVLARDRVFNQWRTFWVFLGQVLSVSQNCSEALKKAQAWLWYKEKKRFHPTRLLFVKLALG